MKRNRTPLVKLTTKCHLTSNIPDCVHRMLTVIVNYCWILHWSWFSDGRCN